MQTNRRSHIRYPGENLTVLVRHKNSDEQDWVKGVINTIDFNHHGIGIETDHRFTVGEIITLIIRIDDACFSELSGIVCNRYKSKLGFRCGIQFHLSTTSVQLAELIHDITGTRT